jgi:hypothetical protein
MAQTICTDKLQYIIAVFFFRGATERIIKSGQCGSVSQMTVLTAYFSFFWIVL